MKNISVNLTAIILVVIALVICYFKVTELGLPLTPTESAEAWTVEARVSFEANKGPTKVQLIIPNDMPGFTMLDEDYISSNYGLAIQNNPLNRRTQWAKRRVTGPQVLYYRVELLAENKFIRRTYPVPSYPKVPDYEEPFGAAAKAILNDVRRKSADVVSFTQELLSELNSPMPNENAEAVRRQSQNDFEWARNIIQILAGARIPARMVYILRLQDGIRHGTLEPWIEVYNDKEWIAFDPKNATQGYGPDILLWRTGEDPLVTVEGGESADVEFSIVKHSKALVTVAEQRARQVDSKIMEFSLFSLPLHIQNVFRILLLLPLGALVVVIMRNIVGIKTFGTFMPVLIAFSFRETNVIWGVLLFVMLVATGLLFRFVLEKLYLLLIPRLASVVTIVILLAAVMSVVLHKLGISQGLSLALFPVVIVSMTIERMSTTWEENGSKEAFMQGFGSLTVAILSYLIMNVELLAHLAFVFPELLLIVLAATLVLGRYTGYRLTEYWRFRFAGRARS